MITIKDLTTLNGFLCKKDVKTEIIDTNLIINNTYQFSLIDQDLDKLKVNVPTISRELTKLSKYHKLDEDPTCKAICDELGMHQDDVMTYGGHTYKKTKWKRGLIASGNMYCRQDLKDTPLKVYCYDINSAYPYAMMQDMPDTRNIKKNQILKPGQVGFDASLIVYTKPGLLCKYVCDLIESPFKSYIDKYYKKKKNATCVEDRQNAKDHLNYATGVLAIHNPFLRNMVIYYSNKYVTSFIDENTVYSNIDSIYSLTPREDILLSGEIGQFKLEHENEDFTYLGIMQYQIGKEVHKCGSHGLADIHDTDATLHYELIYAKNKLIKVIKKEGF